MKRITLALVFAIVSVFAVAQAPHMFSYQAVARDNSGLAIANKLLKVRFSIIDQTASGTVLYSEVHDPTTNLTGLFTLNVGAGTPSSGSFAAIDWAAGSKYLKVEVDMTGQGTTYSLYGTTQLISVPYALYAEKSGNSGGSSIWTESGNTASYSGNVSIDKEIHVKSFAYFDTTIASPYIVGGVIQSDDLYVGSQSSAPKFQIPYGAATGKVLTSDFMGNASWQYPPASNQQDTILKVRNTNNNRFLTIKQSATDTVTFDLNTDGNMLNITSNNVILNTGAVEGTIASMNLNNIYGSNISWTEDVVFTPAERVRIFGTKATITNQDIYITQANKGVIMKSPNGACWRMTVNDSGAPQFTSITCP